MNKKIVIETDQLTYDLVKEIFDQLNLSIEDAINIFFKEAIIENTIPQIIKSDQEEIETFLLSKNKIIN